MSSRSKNNVQSIQALRALAVSYVVLDHAFPNLIPGGYIGVDIFFVISGFLITSHLVRRLHDNDLKLVDFYLHRAKRLLPAALLVIVACALVSILLLPPARIASIMLEISAASIYGINWVLAWNSIDYFSDSGAASPVRHYWSLSVEEQFYIVWPAVLIMCFRFERSFTDRLKLTKFLLAAMVISSLAYSSIAVIIAPTESYFVTHGRIWEFGSGAIAALGSIHGFKKLTSLWKSVLFCSAWTLLFCSGWAYHPNSGVPGLVAIPVVVATCLILIVGDDHKIKMASNIISTRPIQWLGDISYSIYLWHWPILIFAPFAVSVPQISVLGKLACLLLTLLLAQMTFVFVESKFRYSDPKRKSVYLPRHYDLRNFASLSVLVMASAFVGLAALSFSMYQDRRAQYVANKLYDLSRNPDKCFGALAVDNDCPDSSELRDEVYSLQSWKTQVANVPNGNLCQNVAGDAGLHPCSFGFPKSIARKRIAMLGDSHVGMWGAALAEFALQDKLHFIAYLASSCPATDSAEGFAVYLPVEKREACRTWREDAATAIIEDTSIDTVFVSANAYASKILTDGQWADDDGSGYASLWKRLIEAGKHIVVVEDVPVLPWTLPECLVRPHYGDGRCTHPRTQEVGQTPLGRAVKLLPPGSVDYIDFTNVFCNMETCRSIIGGIPAYMDADHVSAPFARSLAPKLRELFH